MAPSLLEKHQDDSEVDFLLPLPLTMTEKKSSMKKTKRCVYSSPGSLISVILVADFQRFFFPKKTSWGSAGEDSGADTAQPKRWLVSPAKKKGLRNTFTDRKDHQTLLQESHSCVHTSQDGKSERDQKLKVHPREAGFSLKTRAADHRWTETCCQIILFRNKIPDFRVVVVT